MRSALAGTASKVVALKTTAAVPMSVIERMFHLPVVTANNKGRSHSVPQTQARTLCTCAGNGLPLFMAVIHSRLGTAGPLRVFICIGGPTMTRRRLARPRSLPTNGRGHLTAESASHEIRGQLSKDEAK